MKSSYRDHLISKFKPTFFGLFQTQYESIMDNVYAYIYNKPVWSSAFISTCRGPVSGHYRDLTLTDIQREFDVYNTEVQAQALARVNKYVVDFNAATVFIPTPEQKQRLLEVRNYFQSHIKVQPSNATDGPSII